MDVILEVLDTFLFDRLYATLFPLPGLGKLPSQEGSNILTDGANNLSSILFYQQHCTNNSTLNGVNGENTVNSLKACAKYVASGATPSGLTRLLSVPMPKTFLFDATEYSLMSKLPRDNIFRQFVSLFLITWIFGFLLYFLTASFSYFTVFDKKTFNHPRYLKNQMRMEINTAVCSLPIMALLTVPWFIAEIHGYSKLYWNVDDYGIKYLIFQYPAFVMFTDFGIYLIHRGLHHRSVYRPLHKPHHKWIMPTPFASHAFHPVDGYLQSLPYHIFPFLFPLHKISYLILFSFVNLWTVMIHDGEFVSNNPFVNGAACHAIHHLYFNYNYGQFTTLWDRIGKSYRKPEEEFFNKDLKMSEATWKKQVEIHEKIKHEIDEADLLLNEKETHEKVYLQDKKHI